MVSKTITKIYCGKQTSNLKLLRFSLSLCCLVYFLDMFTGHFCHFGDTIECITLNWIMRNILVYVINVKPDAISEN